MKSEDTRNLFLAIALSVMVMAGWQYFYAGPLYQREHQAQLEANQANPVAPPAPDAQPSGTPAASPPGAPVAATPPGAPSATTPATVEAALTVSPRVMIDTPSVGGSIAL